MRLATLQLTASSAPKPALLSLALAGLLFLSGAVEAQVTEGWRQATMTWQPGHEGSALHDVKLASGRFVAIGAARDGSGVIVASTDGAAWQDVTPDRPARLEALGVWPWGFMAMGHEGVVATSPDGLTWTLTHSPELDRCEVDDVVWAGDRLVAVGTSLDPVSFTTRGCAAASADGSAWQAQLTDGPLYAVAWTGERVVAVGWVDNGILLPDITQVTLWSLDGLEWRLCDYGWEMSSDVAFNGGRLVVAASQYRGLFYPDLSVFKTSSGDCSWQTKSYTYEGPSFVNGVLWAGTSWLALGPGVFSSLDGLTFSPELTEIEGQPLEDLQAGAVSGNTVVAVGGSGIISGRLQPEPPLGDPDLALRVVPTAAHAPGVGGVLWTTDLVMRNFGSDPVHATVYLLQKGVDNRNAEARPVVIQPWAYCDAADVVLGSFLQPNTAGGLAIQADGPLVIGSKTTATGGLGSYGQHVPALPAETALGQGDEGRLIGLAHSAAYRTNLGLVNISPKVTLVTVEAHDASGGLVGTAGYGLRPYQFFQVNDFFARLGVMEIEDAWVLVRPTSPGARLMTYASVIDNRTGDPGLVLPLEAVSTEPLYLPGVAHAPGAHGTLWRTDLAVHNPSDREATYRIDLLPAWEDNSSPRDATFALGPGASSHFPDVLDTVFGFTGSAALRVTPISGTVSASARTYNETPAGTYGQLIAGLPLSATTPPEGGWSFVGLADCPQSASGGYRTNLGILNPGATPLSAEVVLGFWHGKGPSGPPVIRVDLPPYGFVPLNRPFVTSECHADFWAVVRPREGGAALLAYASVVDNVSGDPVYIPGE